MNGGLHDRSPACPAAATASTTSEACCSLSMIGNWGSSGGIGGMDFKVYAFRAIAVLALHAIITSIIPQQEIVGGLMFLGVTYTGLEYHDERHGYMKFLRSYWEKLPEVEATPIPELDARNGFSREKMLELSNNMRDVIVIRNAFPDSTAVEKWGREYFLENYADDKIVGREVIKQGSSGAGDDYMVRLQRRSFREFYSMLDKGRNMSIVASSIIFADHPELDEDLRAPGIEQHLVGPAGDKIMANQMFMTPGGRSWYHSAVGNNVFRQVAGQKRWTVISPKYNFYMCSRPVIAGTSVNPDCLMKMTDDERELWIKRIPRQTALLNPGDILINAPWWWHDVQSIGKVGEPQCSVAGRIGHIKGSLMNSPLQTVNARKCFYHSSDALSLFGMLAVFTKIRSGGGSKENFKYDLENNIVDSWLKECLEQGKIQCLTDP